MRERKMPFLNIQLGVLAGLCFDILLVYANSTSTSLGNATTFSSSNINSSTDATTESYTTILTTINNSSETTVANTTIQASGQGNTSYVTSVGTSGSVNLTSTNETSGPTTSSGLLIITTPTTSLVGGNSTISISTTYNHTTPVNTSANTNNYTFYESTTLATDSTSVDFNISIDDTSKVCHAKEGDSVLWNLNTRNIVIIVVVMGAINIASLVLAFFIFSKIARRNQRWDRPPSRFGSCVQFSQNHRFSRPPVECARISGRDLAADSDCKEGESKQQETVQISTKDPGWCVPIQQDKKQRNKTDDTGV